jgi:hypothetical protein
MRRPISLDAGVRDIEGQTNPDSENFNLSRDSVEKEIIAEERERQVEDILEKYFEQIDSSKKSKEDSAAESGELLDRLLEIETKYNLERNKLIDMIGRVYNNVLNSGPKYQADENIGNSIFLDIAWRSVWQNNNSI